MAIDLFLYDDQHLSRVALAALLEKQAGIRVVGTADSTGHALEFAEQHRPGIVIMSCADGDDDTFVAAEKIAGLPPCRTLLLGNALSLSAVRRAFTGGISGIVERSDPLHRFMDTIHRAYQGERIFDTETTVAALGYVDTGDGGCPLTAREFSVLEHVSRGDPVAEIAAELFLSEGTVRNYITSIVGKLGARNRIDAVRVARETRLI